MTTVYGIGVSPFVRKVRLALELKGIDYANEPVVPMALPDDFLAMSPMGKIPAFQDDQVTVADSSVICEYLEERYPEVPLMPVAPAERARCRFLEEYGDTAVVNAATPMFFETVVKPNFMQQEPDQAALDTAFNEVQPQVYGYLEQQVPDSGFLFGDNLSMADIGIVCPIITGHMLTTYAFDEARWPRLGAYLQRVLQQPVVAARVAAEQQELG